MYEIKVVRRGTYQGVPQSRNKKTREFLRFSCPHGHQWDSMRFTDSFHPQEPNCPTCGRMWAIVCKEMPEESDLERARR